MLFNSRKEKIGKKIKKANALFDSFNREESLQEFEKLQKEFPENIDVLFGLAVVQNSFRQQALAIETLQSILKINSSHQDTLLILPTVIYEYAIRLTEDGKKEFAKQYLLEFISIDNDNKADLANGYKELALIEEHFGNLKEAEKYINTSLDIISKIDNTESIINYKNDYNEVRDRIKGS